MRDVVGKWGLVTGLVASALGVGALVLGLVVEPIPARASAEGVVAAIFVRGLLVLLALGMALALGYLAGYQTERHRPLDDSTGTVPAQQLRTHAALAGAITMGCYWVATTAYMLLTGSATASFIGPRIVFGIVVVLVGAGLGGLGARQPAARRLLSQLTVTPPAER